MNNEPFSMNSPHPNFYHWTGALEYAIAFIGALALQGGPIFWVAAKTLG